LKTVPCELKLLRFFTTPVLGLGKKYIDAKATKGEKVVKPHLSWNLSEGFQAYAGVTLEPDWLAYSNFHGVEIEAADITKGAGSNGGHVHHRVEIDKVLCRNLSAIASMRGQKHCIDLGSKLVSMIAKGRGLFEATENKMENPSLHRNILVELDELPRMDGWGNPTVYGGIPEVPRFGEYPIVAPGVVAVRRAPVGGGVVCGNKLTLIRPRLSQDLNNQDTNHVQWNDFMNKYAEQIPANFADSLYGNQISTFTFNVQTFDWTYTIKKDVYHRKVSSVFY